MAVWALADLHLSFGVANKSMAIFGEQWQAHAEQIRTHWQAQVSPEDLVLIAGDISWAMRIEEALPDLEWIDALNGTKVMIRGNHDYWWNSYSKVQKILPPSIHAIQHNTWQWQDISIGGTRLWDSKEYQFGDVIDFRPNAAAAERPEGSAEDREKIFVRELQRLEISLRGLDQKARLRIVMTHYPPIGLDLEPSRASDLLEQYNVDLCVFGHLHSVKRGQAPFGTKGGVRYVLTSCDYLDFKPLRLL